MHKIKGCSVYLNDDDKIIKILDKDGIKRELYIKFNGLWIWVNHECYTFKQLKNGIYKDRMRFA